MENRYRSYPYPVLTFYGDDYVDSVFSTNVSNHSSGYDLVFDLKTTLKNEGLAQLIMNGQATFIYDFECSQTGYRCCFKSDKTELSVSIKEPLLNGVLTIFPFIVAREDIYQYRNEHFNEDYGDASFEINKGKYLAVGQSTQVRIKKKDSDLLKSSSIFSIIPNSEMKDEMQVDFGNGHIIIKLAKRDYERCWSMFSNANLKDLLNSAIVVPALLSVLNRLSKMGKEECEAEYSGEAWYESIKKVLKTRFNKEISDIDSDNSFMLAQKMLKTPIGTAIERLIDLRDKNLEEGDE